MPDYELTRRDVLAALGAAGVGAGAVGVATLSDEESSEATEPPLSARDTETLTAVARAVYPTAVSGVGEFVKEYVVTRARAEPSRAEGVAAATADLREYTRDWYEAEYRELSRERRATVLAEMGVDETDPDPEGSDLQRLRFYVVNELLFALYATPTGAELVGLENPQGYPGGTTSYRRGPD